MRGVSAKEEARRWAEEVHRAGGRVALVPTMGFLHRGHAALIEAGVHTGAQVAVSVFVTPLQFGPREDLAHYPLDAVRDREVARGAGAALLFTPDPEEMYPEGFATRVEVAGLSERWCGAARPGHFQGVATVVTKLLNLFRPDEAYFGEKDYQQLVLLRRLARDLDFGCRVVGVPTVREEDGLALSSRNAYLSPEERRRARAIPAALAAAAAAHARGERDAEELRRAALQVLKGAPGVRVEYVAVVDPETLEPLEAVRGPVRMLLAAWVGSTRLIDNRFLAGA